MIDCPQAHGPYLIRLKLTGEVDKGNDIVIPESDQGKTRFLIFLHFSSLHK